MSWFSDCFVVKSILLKMLNVVSTAIVLLSAFVSVQFRMSATSNKNSLLFVEKMGSPINHISQENASNFSSVLLLTCYHIHTLQVPVSVSRGRCNG